METCPGPKPSVKSSPSSTKCPLSSVGQTWGLGTNQGRCVLRGLTFSIRLSTNDHGRLFGVCRRGPARRAPNSPTQLARARVHNIFLLFLPSLSIQLSSSSLWPFPAPTTGREAKADWSSIPGLAYLSPRTASALRCTTGSFGEGAGVESAGSATSRQSVWVRAHHATSGSLSLLWWWCLHSWITGDEMPAGLRTWRPIRKGTILSSYNGPCLCLWLFFFPQRRLSGLEFPSCVLRDGFFLDSRSPFADSSRLWHEHDLLFKVCSTDPKEEQGCVAGTGTCRERALGKAWPPTTRQR